jgi:type IV pilus assembly protein PilA
VVAALLPGALAIGTEAGVKALLTQRQHPSAARPPGSILARLGEASQKDTTLALGVRLTGFPDPQVAQMIASLGLEQGIAVYGNGKARVAISGDPAQLGAVKGLVMAALEGGVKQAELAKQKATQENDALAGAMSIVAYHQVRKLFKEVEPKQVGRELVSEYQLPKTAGGDAMTITAFTGILAAVAIPAFMKYIRHSKTSEASVHVHRGYSAAASYAAEHAGQGKRFAFPASTGWTPAAPCCGHPGGKCAPDASAWTGPTWRALEFSVDEPHYYQYRFTSEGKGAAARFTIEARGDLNCDGVYSSYKMEGEVDGRGDVRSRRGLEITNDLE